MKARSMVMLSACACISLALGACSSPFGSSSREVMYAKPDAREIAWKSLSKSEKKEVDGDWKDAKVSKVIADTSTYRLDDASFAGKEVTLVTIRSDQRELLGDIQKLVDEASGKVIGSSMRK